MRLSPELRPNRWDALVVLAVVLLAAGCAWAVWSQGTGGDTLTAVIQTDSGQERLARGSGETEWLVESNGDTLRLCLTETEVWVEEADCPTQDCVHTGHISRSGQSIVCLPARVIITLEGGQPADTGVDVVVG